MRSLVSDQVAYAQAVVAQLWPAASPPTLTSRPTLRSQSEDQHEWFLLPNPRRPTLLVPSGVRQASRMLQRHGDRRLPRLTRAGLAKAIQAGLMRQSPMSRLQVSDSAESHRGSDGSVLDHIAQAVPGVQACGLILGTPRPNRKPVLQLFAADGTTIGFAKIGMTPATRRLVRTEAANLEVVGSAELRLLEVPRILHLGTFNNADVLVLSPMESSQERRERQMPLPAMRELAHFSALESQPLTSSDYWRGLERDVAESGNAPGASRTGELMGRVSSRWSTTRIDLGNWHGDWAPWNMGSHNGIVQLWDWERFSSPVPIGFDAIHFAAQGVRHNRPDTAELEEELISRAEGLLAEMNSPAGVEHPRLVLALYLLTLSSRFAQMAAESQTQTLHPRARWGLEFAARIISGNHDSAVRVP
jgi:hypothetical protein